MLVYSIKCSWEVTQDFHVSDTGYMEVVLYSLFCFKLWHYWPHLTLQRSIICSQRNTGCPLATLASYTEHSFNPAIKDGLQFYTICYPSYEHPSPLILPPAFPSQTVHGQISVYVCQDQSRWVAWVAENGSNWWKLVCFWSNCPRLPGQWVSTAAACEHKPF